MAAGVTFEDAFSLRQHGDFMLSRYTPDGAAGGYTDGERRGDLVLARFLPDGALDPAFGDRGVTRTDLGSHSEFLKGVALLPDGRIMAGGQVSPQAHGDFAALRYDASGHLDRSFGSDGLVAVDFSGREDRVHAVASPTARWWPWGPARPTSPSPGTSSPTADVT